jgi:5-methylcytosine-specific restriction endonuclease McrA
VQTTLAPFGQVWQTRCLHCRATHFVKLSGEAISAATLEHIVPQAWFEKDRIISTLGLDWRDPHDVRNLAIACARCNHSKGVRHDPHPDNARARELVLKLLKQRAERAGHGELTHA